MPGAGLQVIAFLESQQSSLFFLRKDFFFKFYFIFIWCNFCELCRFSTGVCGPPWSPWLVFRVSGNLNEKWEKKKFYHFLKSLAELWHFLSLSIWSKNHSSINSTCDLVISRNQIFSPHIAVVAEITNHHVCSSLP